MDKKLYSSGIVLKDIVDFQSGDQDQESRHYFEVIAATTDLNRNLYEFTPDALKMLAEDFKSNKTLTINHEKGYFDNTLGIGATVDASYRAGKLRVVSYISMNKTYPKGPFANSEELRDGIVDGFIDSVSQSCYVNKATCSVCKKPYTMSYYSQNDDTCKHYRGQEVIVEEDGEKIVKTVHVIVHEAEAVELSLVQMGADRSAKVSKKAVDFSVDDFIDVERYKLLNQLTPSEGGNNLEDSKMSAELIQTLTSRAEAAEKTVADLRVEVETTRSEKAVLESQNMATKAQVASLSTEKAALQSQIDSLTTERDQLKTQVEKKDAEISTLTEDAIANKVIIADGKAARENYEKEYVNAYVAAIGDDCTDEDRELQEETCKSFSIEVLKRRTEGFKKAAASNYPSGKAVKTGDDGDDDDNTESYPIGI